MNQFCGGNEAFCGLIDSKYRHGFENRDYETCLYAITSLIDYVKMSEIDRQRVLSFFQEKWKLYGETTPQLMFIPVSKIDSYEKEYEDLDQLLEDVISGQVTPDLDYCCNFSISPDGLSYFDMSELIPRLKMEHNTDQMQTIDESIERLKCFSLEDIRIATQKNNTMEDDELKISQMPHRVCVIKKIVDEEYKFSAAPGTILDLEQDAYENYKIKYGDSIQDIIMTKDDWIELLTKEAIECASKIELLEKASGKKFESRNLGMIPKNGQKINVIGYGGGLPDVYNKVEALKMDVFIFEAFNVRTKDNGQEDVLR